MKRLMFYAAAFSGLLISCNTELIEEEEVGGDTHLLRLKTASQGDDVIYPLQVYAYDANANVIKNQEITSASDELSMELSTGTYTIAAVSGGTDFSSGYAAVPLMLAKSNVTITTKDETATLGLQYAVARLSVALSDVPEDVNKVTINVASLYNKITPLNNLSESKPVELSCKYDENDGLWKTDTVYVLPSDGDVTTFTIKQYKDENTIKEYTYEYKAKLSAGTPYYFKGTYDSGIVSAKLTLTLEGAEWGEAVNNEFAFGEGVNENDDNIPVLSDASVFYVAEMPEPCSVWDGHVVATIDEDGNALLFSLKEWGPINTLSEVSTEIEGYSENNVIGWSVPTEEQANILCSLYKNSGIYGNVALAKLLESVEADELHYQKDADKEGYLLQDESREYNFYLGNVRNKKASTHYLRLVKPVRFVVKN